jgi:hypothetical protein
MPVWRIFPVARESSARWLDYAHWSEVIVRAPTAARARVVASAELKDRSEPIGNESAAGYAALEDEKLYHVVRVEPADDDGPEAVLEARWK